MLPECPPRLPNDLQSAVLQFAAAWAGSPLRPRIRPEIGHAWDELIRDWLQAESLPLFIRKASAARGEPVLHTTGRPLIPCDNSVAVWAYTLALEGTCPTLSEVVSAIREGTIPVAFTRLGRFSAFYDAGWKLAHIVGVGLASRTPLDSVPIGALHEHFLRLVAPLNMFAIPKRWAGLGEIPEVVEVIRTYDGLSHREPRPVLARARASASAPRRPASTPVARAAHAPIRHANTYRASRLLFRADIIEPLAAEEAFRIMTPEGTFEMTKAEFRHSFANVVESKSYQQDRVYSYSRTPGKAMRFLVPAEQPRG